MIEGLPRIKEFVETVVTPVVQTLVDIISTVWTVVQPALQSLFEWFTEKGLPFIQDAIDLVTGVAQIFVDLLVGAWEFIKPAVEGLRDGLKAIFDWIIANVLDPVIKRVEDLLGIVEEAKRRLDALRDARQRAGQQIAEGIRSGNVTADDIRNIPSATNEAMRAEGGIWGLMAGINDLVNPNLVRDSGGPGMAGMPYWIGKGAQPELFVPQENGTFYPNADRMLGGGDTYQINVEVPDSVMQNPAMAEQVGRDFGAAIMTESRRKGGV
jgi:hypothetical protein